MSGGEGDDVLYGDAGNDTFVAQRAATKDIVAGGEGDDSYLTYTLSGVTHRLEIVEAANQGWDRVLLDNTAKAWTLAENVEELDARAFSAVFTRTLTGNGLGNLIRAGQANDLILAGAGADTVEGGEGADTLDGEAGADTVSGEAGDDVLRIGSGDSVAGGTGQDTFVLSRAGGLTATVVDFIHAQGDQLDISAFLEGATDPFGLGLLRLEAREGGAALVYADPTLPAAGREVAFLKGVTASELTGADFRAVAADGQAVSVEPKATGSSTIRGSESADWLEGTDRNDVLNALGGNDNVLGGLGNDTLIGGAGNDSLNGEGGSDTASYETASLGVTVDLAVRTIQATGGAGNDKLTAIENLTGSSFADTLAGDANANRLAGGAGADILRGLAGADTLDGGAGADILYGGAGVDRFIFDSLSGDTIRDWERGEVIDVSALHAAGMRLSVMGAETRADFDLDGDGLYGDAVLTISSLVVQAADFLL
jgi:Ca2+-binding RTX toxin-like protein